MTRKVKEPYETVSLYFPKSIVKRLKEYSKNSGMSNSAVTVEALKNYLGHTCPMCDGQGWVDHERTTEREVAETSKALEDLNDFLSD